ncbi:MAG: Rrf2 family transcriptional regulator [Thermoanaerobaculia bacterium]|jgi:Rrf2 family protein
MVTITAEYAMRAMIALAQVGGETSVLGRDLAVRSGVPANYLAKILLVLNRAGLVTASRGAGGGYYLNRRADEIRLVEIVDVFDSNGAHPRCLLDVTKECADSTPCTAHEQWRSVRLTYVAFLNETSLKDIAGI